MSRRVQIVAGVESKRTPEVPGNTHTLTQGNQKVKSGGKSFAARLGCKALSRWRDDKHPAICRMAFHVMRGII